MWDGHFCDKFTVKELLKPDSSTIQELKTQLPANDQDVVVAATSIHQELTVQMSSDLRAGLRSCFPNNTVVINESFASDSPSPASLLVQWVRAWVDVAAVGHEAAFKHNRHAQQKNSSRSVDSDVLSLCGTLYEHGTFQACQFLLPHISNGSIFDQEPAKVLKFIKSCIHGIKFLNSIGSCSEGFGLLSILQFLKRPYPKDLKSFIIEVFEPHTHLVEYLCVSFSLSKSEVSHVLKFKAAKRKNDRGGYGVWATKDESIVISWTGNHFALTISGEEVSTQELSCYRWNCIPSLGCLQSTGNWRVEASNVPVMNVQVKLGSAAEWTTAAVGLVGPAGPGGFVGSVGSVGLVPPVERVQPVPTVETDGSVRPDFCTTCTTLNEKNDKEKPFKKRNPGTFAQL